MKWGARIISRLYWLSKFKNMRINSEPNPAKILKHNSPSVASPEPHYSRACCSNEGDKDASWSLRYNNKTRAVAANAIPSSSRLANANKHGRRLKSEEKKDIGVGGEGKLVNDGKVPTEMDECNRDKEYEKLRMRFQKKAQQVLQEQLLKLETEASSNAMEMESPTSTRITICTPTTHSFVSCAGSGSGSNGVFRTRTDLPSHRKLSSVTVTQKELKVNANKQRKPLTHAGSRELQRRKPKHSSRVRVYSPRMASRVELCKTKALQDARKAKLKTKKREETPGLDTFAVIKCSLDPKHDFKDSMIEMITEKRLTWPEEMEELLACYLTLNADEYHDLIVKVFRQVWLQHMQCCFHR